MKVKVFKTEVPTELFLELLRPLGIKSLHDSHWIDREIFTQKLIKELELLLPLIEPYYQTHAKHYVHREVNIVNYMQILRHICRQKGMKIVTRESGKRKLTQYRLESDTQTEFTLTWE